MTKFEQTRSFKAVDNLEREIFPGVYVGKFPPDARSARIGFDKVAQVTETNDSHWVLRLRRGLAMLLATGIAGLLGAMAWGQLESGVKPGDRHPRLVEVQRAQGPRLTIAATIVAAPSAQTPLHVRIGPGNEVPTKSFLHISGLPPPVLLSAGHTVGPGEWVIPLSALSNVAMSVPAAVSGKFELVISLFEWEESYPRPMAQARTTLVIAPLGASTAPAEVASSILIAKPNHDRDDIPPQSSLPDASTATAPEPQRVNSNAIPVELPARVPDEIAWQPSPADLRTESATRPEPQRTSSNAAFVEFPPRVPEETARQPSSADTRTELVVTRDSQEAIATPAPADVRRHSAEGGQLDRTGESAARQVLTLTQEERARAETFVARGQRYLGDGNVELARRFFLRAAEAGLARGALLLGATYDPHELANLRVGIQGNPVIARKWYERARALDVSEVEETMKTTSKHALLLASARTGLESGAVPTPRCVMAGGWGTGALQGFASFMAEGAMNDAAKSKLGDSVRIGIPDIKCEAKGLLYECTAYAPACR